MNNPDKKYTAEGPVDMSKTLTLKDSGAAEKPAAQSAVKKHVPPLAGQDFCELGQVSLDFHSTPNAGMTLKDILAPSYWNAVANRLKTGCEVRVIPKDNAWYAKLLVLSKDSISAQMAVIQFSDLRQKSEIGIDDFDVRPTHNNTKFGVFRKSDGKEVKQGFVTEKQADDFRSDYVRAQAA